MFDLRHGDCLDVLRGMADNSVDAIVTDPPYGLSFMGKRWDYDVPSEDIWRECLRVLKPGGHLLAFAGTRTQHRMAVRIEDAGFEIRDMIAWVYGSGFPKSMDVSKAMDKAAGAERTEVIGTKLGRSGMAKDGSNQSFDSSVNTYGGGGILPTDILAPATDAARQWHGWGTALKPALEPITVARKPLIGTVAENVLTWGTGGVNVDASRVGGEQGRWPANLIHDGSEEVVQALPQTGPSPGNYVRSAEVGNRIYGGGVGKAASGDIQRGFADSGSAARFFYCAKASKRDRDEGCEGMDEREAVGGMKATGLCRKCGRQKVNTSGECQCAKPDFGPIQRRRTNHHPTVKPTDLMRYLCRLVTPPGGTVLDPFMGSGSTGKAAVLEGFNFIGIEREAEYLDIARARIEHVTKEPNLWQS